MKEERSAGTNMSSSNKCAQNLNDSANGDFDFSSIHDFICNKKSQGTSEILAWFASDQRDAIPACYLLDIVATLAGRQFLSTVGLGAKLLSEFGSIKGVLAADTSRLSRWLSQEVEADWFIDQVCLRIKASATLMKHALAEEIQERPIISSWQTLLDYLKLSMGGEAIEQFRVLFLDRKNSLIKDELQQQGTVDHTPLYPREVAKRSLELGASAVILVHNHPSGDPTPSRADIEMTKQVEAALAPLQISIHDHLIISAERYLSFRSQGLL